MTKLEDQKWKLTQMKYNEKSFVLGFFKVNRASDSFGRISSYLIFMYLDLGKRRTAEKYLRNSGQKLFKFQENCKPTDPRSSVNSKHMKKTTLRHIITKCS